MSTLHTLSNGVRVVCVATSGGGKTTFTVSLGAWKPRPSTWRGTIVSPASSAAGTSSPRPSHAAGIIIIIAC